MIVSTFLNLFIIPILYVLVRLIIPMKHETVLAEPLPEAETADKLS
jgi:hypothetical protein